MLQWLQVIDDKKYVVLFGYIDHINYFYLFLGYVYVFWWIRWKVELRLRVIIMPISVNPFQWLRRSHSWGMDLPTQPLTEFSNPWCNMFRRGNDGTVMAGRKSTAPGAERWCGNMWHKKSHDVTSGWRCWMMLGPSWGPRCSSSLNFQKKMVQSSITSNSYGGAPAIAVVGDANGHSLVCWDVGPRTSGSGLNPDDCRGLLPI